MFATETVPNSGCRCRRRGAALLALSVSVRGRRAAAAAITVARRCPATVANVSLEIRTPLRCTVDDVGLLLLRRTLSVPASDVFGGRRLVYSRGFQELEGCWKMMIGTRGSAVVDPIDRVG